MGANAVNPRFVSCGCLVTLLILPFIIWGAWWYVSGPIADGIRRSLDRSPLVLVQVSGFSNSAVVDSGRVRVSGVVHDIELFGFRVASDSTGLGVVWAICDDCCGGLATANDYVQKVERGVYFEYSLSGIMDVTDEDGLGMLMTCSNHSFLAL